MNLGIFRTAICVGVASCVVSGCTTVDLQTMATAGSAAEAPADVNVVERAVEKLKAAFASRGFGESSSRMKMQAAADVLVNGLSAKTVSSDEDGYADTPKPASVVLADLDVATRHVVQTSRAAEIYLEVAPSDRDISAELKSLEIALLASERANLDFASALADETPPALIAYRDAVDGLRRITDDFGLRVRMSRSGKIGLDAARIDTAS